MNSESMRVDKLGLTPMTASILQRNGIETLSDLLLLDASSIGRIEGLSRHRAIKVREFLEKWRMAQNIDNIEMRSERTVGPGKLSGHKTISSYLEAQQISKRNIEIFVKYYADSNVILEEIASEYGLTRERVRQICGRCMDIVRRGLCDGSINPKILENIEQAAEAKTEINMINVSDELLGREGLIKIVVYIYRERYEIIRSEKLNGSWLVKKEENVKTMIDYLSKTLQERDTPMPIKDVLSIFPINEEMLFSVKNIIEKDGYITLSTNKTVTGRIPRIKKYLAKINRPASIQEISKNTGLTINQIRGAVSDKNEFENVGKSVYDSVDANYIDFSPSELAKNILLAEGRAITVQQIIKYVKRYDRSDLSDRDIMIDLFSRSDSAVYHMDGYVLLNEWGTEKIQKPARRGYIIELKEAIKAIIPRMEYIFDAEQILEEVKKEYGDSTSNNLNSTKGYLNTLAKNNVIVEVGKNTGCYRRP